MASLAGKGFDEPDDVRESARGRIVMVNLRDVRLDG